jgi:hypothetical protein
MIAECSCITQASSSEFLESRTYGPNLKLRPSAVRIQRNTWCFAVLGNIVHGPEMMGRQSRPCRRPQAQQQ